MNELIKEVVRETIAELKRSGMLKNQNEVAYSEISATLRAFYRADKPQNIKAALKEIESDPYYEIIPLYFQQDFTNEKIAEILDVEISTVVRNKKRLCLAIYEIAQQK